MWLPQEMTELEIIIPERYGPQVTALLADEGAFQQEDASYLSVEVDPLRKDQGDWRSKATDYANMERHLTSTMKSLGVDENPVQDGKLDTIVDPEQIRPIAEGLEHEVQIVLDQLAATKKQIDKLQSYVDQLTPFIDLDIQFDKIRNRRYLYSLLGIIPTDNISRLKTSLTKVPFALLIMKQDTQSSVVLLLGIRQNKEILRRAARSAYLNAIDLPDEYQGTPLEIVGDLKERISDLRNELAQEDKSIGNLRSNLAQQFQKLLWRVRISRMMAEAMTHYGKLRYTYLVVGWVPSSNVDELSQRLMRISNEIVIDTRKIARASGKQEAPIKLQNPGLVSAFEGLVTTYGLPGYHEVDPTFLLALTFPLLFGAMFGDVGHGAFLAILGGLLVSRKIKKLAGMASAGIVVTACGISAMIFGVLYGSVFGVETWLPALWLHPMDNIMSIITVTIAAGVGILTMANALSLVNSFRKRQWGHFFFGGTGLSGLLFYWSLLGLVLGLMIPNFPVPSTVFVAVAIVMGVLVFFSDMLSRLLEKRKPLFEGGVVTFFIQSLFEMIETLIGFLSNTLSYARVGAFAVAHGGLSAVIFILAEMVGKSGGIGYWIVLFLGNLFIIGFEGMIVGIQTLRLEYYEFFSKFYAGGGNRYLPMQLKQSKKQGAN